LIKNHLLAVLLGFLLDLAAGDPYSTYHPVVLIGKLISFLEGLLYPNGHDSTFSTGKGDNKESMTVNDRERMELLVRGALLTLLVVFTTAAAAVMIVKIAGLFPLSGLELVVETVLCWNVLAVRTMKNESMKVYHALFNGDLSGARYALSMIVGRDTDSLDREEIIKADVETVAEGTCDAVIAPFFYLFIGGPVLGLVYKAVNTMDSMIGYRNSRYEYFGKCAARLDDIMNFIPSRIGALLIILTAYFLPGADGENALSVWKKDRNAHDSINAGQTESAAAGALNIMLGGPALYSGIKKERPVMGHTGHEKVPEDKDIKRMNDLMYGSAWVFGIMVGIVYILS